jgi:hypothetical protein
LSGSESDSCGFTKKTGYVCVNLLSHNQLIIEEGTLFDTGTNCHFLQSINDFDLGTYTPANLPVISTASREAKPLGHGQRTILCAIDTAGEVYTITLSKV